MKDFKRVLVANRGEIALRIVRALKNLGIEPIAVYSDPDAASMHAFEASKAFRLPGAFPNDTYLNLGKIIEIARKADCDAVHPGYGFLSENESFSRICRKNSIKFIGPSPETLARSGNKLECKKIAGSRGVPVIPYTREPLEDWKQAAKYASEIGYPVLLKSAFGGGGKGIKEARSREEVIDAFESSKRETRSSFGRFSLYVEKKIENPRHIEVQILASDDSSEILHLGERECSIQRRYQKLIEMSPSPVVDEETREKLAQYAISMARGVNYSNAGTVEFLRDSKSGKYYFLEINSRLQVEHPVTELVTGVDLVASQVEVARGKSVPFRQRDIKLRGCAIECRINSEDPLSDFLPVTGVVEYLRIPSGPGLRADTALYQGLEISAYYDSLIAKLIAWGSKFAQARRRMQIALDEFKLIGVKNTILFHKGVMKNRAFSQGNFNTSFITESGVLTNLAESEAKAGTDRFAVAALLFSKEQFKSLQADNSGMPRPNLQNRPMGGRFVDGL